VVLLNMWETDRVANLKAPDDTPLPNLYAMRARPNVQDVFLEIGYMYAPAGTTTTYGHADGGVCESPACEQDTDGHSHLPAKEALDMVATAFRNAYGSGAQEQPRGGGVTGPINIHFDVGKNSQPGLPSDQTCLTGNWVPNCAIIPAALARGGESLQEAGCPPNVSCAFSEHPGTVSWKTGYRLIREQPLNYATEEECVEHSDCVRRFDRNRRYSFRYALFAHALGVAMAATDDPNTSFNETTIPTRAAGIADLLGGDILVTLGRWDDFTGTTFMQASTLMHEFGHTTGLRHGGVA